MLIMAKHCYFVLEQPGASLLKKHPRWEHFANQVCFVPYLHKVATALSRPSLGQDTLNRIVLE